MDRYANNPNFTLTITFDKSKKQGAETGNYQWDSSGNLAAATITLGPNLREKGEKAPDGFIPPPAHR